MYYAKSGMGGEDSFPPQYRKRAKVAHRFRKHPHAPARPKSGEAEFALSILGAHGVGHIRAHTLEDSWLRPLYDIPKN